MPYYNKKLGAQVRLAPKPQAMVLPIWQLIS